MSDEPKNPGLVVFTPEAAPVKAWMSMGAIVGFALSCCSMVATTIADGREINALGIAFIVMLVCLGTMQGTGIGFWIGCLAARLKRRKEQPADANHPAG